MIEPSEFVEFIRSSGVSFFAGVPDSLLREFNSSVEQQPLDSHRLVAANEGTAVALAAGHFLATGQLGLAYMQNSGIGNAVNPLLSLVSTEIYAIPVLLLIGWRGEPGEPDEPQHIHQGRMTEALLADLDISIGHLSAGSTNWRRVVGSAVEEALDQSRPTALLISRGAFSPGHGPETAEPSALLSRGEALSEILNGAASNSLWVSTTGYTSRELDYLRDQRGEPKDSDFLVVGSMGHASSVALGVAVGLPGRSVICLDGDGSVAMHMGSLAQVGRAGADNMTHIVFNNGVHESVGGQPSVADSVDLCLVASACGYRHVESVSDLTGIRQFMTALPGLSGPRFLEVQIRTGAPKNLPRPVRLEERAEAFRRACYG